MAVIRNSSWFGTTYQISIRKFDDGNVEVEAWELPEWGAVQHLLYEGHVLHPEFSPVELSRSIPSASSSKVLGPEEKKSALKLLNDLQKPRRAGHPIDDDSTQWVLILQPSGMVSSTTFFGSQYEKLSSRIFHFIQLVLPNRLTFSSIRSKTDEEEANLRRKLKALIDQQPKETFPPQEEPVK